LGDEGFAAQSEFEVRVGRFVLRTLGDVGLGEIGPSVQRLQEFAQ
jgi:RNase P/RNase MRP subunit POP5